MPNYKTPGVYIEEIPAFPPPVAEVETAVPVFIGYTQRAKKTVENDLAGQATEIRSLTEFESYYGGPQADPIAVTVTEDASVPSGFKASGFRVNNAANDPLPSFLLSYSVTLFFANGGGKCYILSVGDFSKTIRLGDLKAGLDVLERLEGPTIVVVPEAVKLSAADYASLVQSMLLHCGGRPPQGLDGRFAILDVRDGGNNLNGAGLSDNRSYFGTKHLSFGAAYYPFLKTTLGYHIKDDETNVAVTYPYVDFAVRVATAAPLPRNRSSKGVLTATANGVLGKIDGVAVAVNDRILVKDEAARARRFNGIYTVTSLGASGAKWVLTRTPDPLKTGSRIGVAQGASATKCLALTTSAPIVMETTPLVFAVAPALATTTLFACKSNSPAVYAFARGVLKGQFAVIPPSGVVAGVYAATDTNRGVWKAPANVSVADVIEPLVRLDNSQQEGLNVDPVSGKSINALRAFAGKGTLVWGARTLDGNSNEWRYVSVRRFFIMVESSVIKSTRWAVFESNDANTWVRVRAAIENYLTQKWREGALAGATTKDAFFVRCGLGTTMTSQDIQEGRMNVEIGMAAVRPAEFIILRFSHAMQTA